MEIRNTMHDARIQCGIVAVLAAIVMFAVHPSSLHAQSSLEVNVDRPSRIVLAEGYTTFTINAINRSAETVNVKVIRTLNDRPDDTWEISVCSPTVCYDETVDTLDPYPLGPGEPGGAQVHVLAGKTGLARVTISLDPQDGTDPVVVELSTEVGIPPQPSIVATVDSTEAHAFGGDTVEFGFFIFNATDDSLDVVLQRTETDFPDSTWSTTLCIFGDCVDRDIDSIPVGLASHRAVLFAVRIGTGKAIGTTGEVEVHVVPADGSEPTYHRFGVTVTQVSGVHDADAGGRNGQAVFFPNPASGTGSIFMPRRFAGKEILMAIADGTGRTVVAAGTVPHPDAAGDRAIIPVDVSALPSGRYFYRLRSGTDAVTGSFIVIR